MKISQVLVLISLLSVSFGALIPKQLAGPASEFAQRAIPNPKMGAQQSRSNFVTVQFKEDTPSSPRSTISWSGPIYVENPTSFMFGFYSPQENIYTLTFTAPNGAVVPLETHAHKGSHPIDSYHFVPTTTYMFNDLPMAGEYTLTISSASTLSPEARRKFVDIGAELIIFNDSPIYIHSYLSTYETDIGKPIGLLTLISDSARSEIGAIPKALKSVVLSAWMDVELPDGNEVDIEMHDDGLHGDEAANDGIFGAQMTASEVGIYKARAIVKGQNADGTQFVRSTEHLINVIDNEVTFAGSALGQMKDSERMTIYINLNVPQTNTATEFRGYAQVWGKDSQGNDVAVCWISSITTLQQFGGDQVIPLEFNLKWATLANAVAPFTLKNAYIMDPFVQVPVDLAAEIPIKTSFDVNEILRRPHIASATEATREMKQGVMPAHLLANVNSTDDGKVILVHGYCAGSNPWSKTPSQWTNAEFFLNANANIGTHAFAEKVGDFAEQKGIKSFSIVGHSQGGMVGTHLYNNFFSGMDTMVMKQEMAGAGGRLIQSVGTPYHGCTGAGSAANLAKLFGAGCGDNSDLTTDGAEKWLAGITEDTKKQVYFYTTTYKLGNLFGDWCNVAVNMVLEWPNDGTTEIVYTTLEGATNLGNTQKQCHTTDMGYPPQYWDANRNAQMNANAAR